MRMRLLACCYWLYVAILLLSSTAAVAFLVAPRALNGAKRAQRGAAASTILAPSIYMVSSSSRSRASSSFSSLSTHYNTLGISQYASKQEIKAQYRKLAKQYHPDANPSSCLQRTNTTKTTTTFQQINHAYQVLMGNEEEEQEYISENEYGIMDDFYYAHDNAALDLGDNLVCSLEIDYSMSVHGGQKMVRLRCLEPCRYCGGSYPYCGACGGYGSMPHEETIVIYIPPQVEEGSWIKMRNYGFRGLHGVGSLFVHLTIKDGWRTNDAYGKVEYVDAYIDNQVALHWQDDEVEVGENSDSEPKLLMESEE